MLALHPFHALSSLTNAGRVPAASDVRHDDNDELCVGMVASVMLLSVGALANEWTEMD